MALLVAGIIKRGWADGMWMMIISSTVIAGYMFFIDIADSIRWDRDRICQSAWDYLSLKPMRHTVRITDITKVEAGLHPANFVPGKPFDRILFISPTDTITVQASFHRREELEELLRLVKSNCPAQSSTPTLMSSWKAVSRIGGATADRAERSLSTHCRHWRPFSPVLTGPPSHQATGFRLLRKADVLSRPGKRTVLQRPACA